MLVVEDDDLVRSFLCRALAGVAGEVDGCATGAEAMSAVARRRYGVILLDGLLPDIHGIDLGRQVIGTKNNTRLLNGIPYVIARLGGASTIKSCGKPVSFLGYQSILGLYLDLNVGNVGYKPGREIGTGQPIVVFRPNGLGWTVRPVHIPAADRARCSSLSINVGPR